MPYIKKEDREKFDSLVEELSGLISNPGDLNYVISSLLHREIVKGGLNYAKCNELIGVMDCASKEFYRKVVAPYEDTKIMLNGDLNFNK